MRNYTITYRNLISGETNTFTIPRATKKAAKKMAKKILAGLGEIDDIHRMPPIGSCVLCPACHSELRLAT